MGTTAGCRAPIDLSGSHPVRVSRANCPAFRHPQTRLQDRIHIRCYYRYLCSLRLRHHRYSAPLHLLLLLLRPLRHRQRHPCLPSVKS